MITSDNWFSDFTNVLSTWRVYKGLGRGQARPGRSVLDLLDFWSDSIVFHVLRLRFDMPPGGLLVESQSVLSTRHGSLSMGLLRSLRIFIFSGILLRVEKISTCHLLPSCHHDIMNHRS